MHESMIVKLDKLQDRLIEIQEMLASPEVVNDIENYTALNKEFSEISPIVTKYEEFIQLDESLKEARELLASDDKDMVELAEAEIAAA